MPHFITICTGWRHMVCFECDKQKVHPVTFQVFVFWEGFFRAFSNIFYWLFSHLIHDINQPNFRNILSLCQVDMNKFICSRGYVMYVFWLYTYCVTQWSCYAVIFCNNKLWLCVTAQANLKTNQEIQFTPKAPISLSIKIWKKRQSLLRFQKLQNTSVFGFTASIGLRKKCKQNHI